MDDPIEEIRITGYAVRKAKAIAERITAIAGCALEVGFYLLNDQKMHASGDIAIRDVSLPYEQTVSSSHYVPSGASLIRDKEKLKPDYVILGWGHSHGNHDVFYSPADNRALEMNLHVGGQEVESKKIECKLSKDQRPEFCINGVLYQLNLGEVKNLDDLYLIKKEKNEFLYGLVVNSHNVHPYGTIGVKTGSDKEIRKDVPIKIIIEPHGMIDIDSIDRKLINSIKTKNQSLKEILKLNIKNYHLSPVTIDLKTYIKSSEEAILNLCNLSGLIDDPDLTVFHKDRIAHLDNLVHKKKSFWLKKDSKRIHQAIKLMGGVDD